MTQREFILRKTPFVFLKRIAYVTFFAIVCVVLVQPSSTPCYLSFKGKEEFYIRTGNSSQPLPVSKATRYMQTRFAA